MNSDRFFSLSHPVASCLTSAIILFTAASSATAQDVTFDTTRGLAGGFPLGVIVGGDSSVSEDVRVKEEGDEGGLPPAFSNSAFPVGPNLPDYSLVRDHPNANAAAQVPVGLMDIDAHSTGNSRIPRFDPAAATPAIETNAWFVVSFSLEGGPVGGSSYFNNPKNEVVSYYFSGNQGVDPLYANAPLVELKRRHLGLNGVGSRYLKAMDYGLGFIAFEDTTMSSAFFNDPHDYYFSITSEYATDFNNGASNSFAVPKGGFPHGGTASLAAMPGAIYKRNWSGGAWGLPEQMYTPQELGLHAGGEIDALDLNPDNGVVIYSVASLSDFESGANATVPEAERDQLMVHQDLGTAGTATAGAIIGAAVKDDSASGPPINVTDRTGVSDIGGGTPGNITTTCTIDPENSVQIFSFGVPSDQPYSSDSERMGMSISRCSTPGNPTAEVHVLVSGWGAHVPDKVTMILYASLVEFEGVAVQQPVWKPVGICERDALSESCSISLDPLGFKRDSRYRFHAVQNNDQRTQEAHSVTMKLSFE